MATLEAHHMELPAKAASSSTARGIVAAVAHQLVCMTDMEIDDLCVAVGEAFANVVRHGADSEHDPVHLHIESKGDRLLVHLVYRSDPFNTSPTPPAPDDLAAGGYGLFIMRTLADVVDFDFQDGTTHLCLEKRCNPLNVPRISDTSPWAPIPGTLHAPNPR